MGFGQVLDNLTFKNMDTFEETDSVSRRLCLEPLFLDICSVKQIFTLITRIKLLWKSYLVCSDINERYHIRQASFTLVFKHCDLSIAAPEKVTADLWMPAS